VLSFDWDVVEQEFWRRAKQTALHWPQKVEERKQQATLRSRTQSSNQQTGAKRTKDNENE